MLKRIIILALLLIAGLTTLALADGGFYGNIVYDDCDCQQGVGAYGDRVMIQSTGGGAQPYYYIRCGSNPVYSTENGTPETFPSGYYNVWVVLGEGSDCNLGFVQTVYHGDGWQEVNLRVEKTPPPDSK
jgi:hypothetical protein